MPESKIAMQNARMRFKSLTSKENSDAGTAGRLALFLTDVWMARMSIGVELCFGYASRTEWVDAAANHLEIFRLHNCTDHAAPHS
jgi:hypothetical protein